MHAGGGQPAREVIERRGEILRLLLEDLQLDGVEIRANFAIVTGSLGIYRVHLASAAIYVEPGQYLCVVPARWGKRHERLFLPFVDAEDEKVGDVDTAPTPSRLEFQPLRERGEVRKRRGSSCPG